MEKSQVYAKYLKAKISPKKVAPVMDIVRGVLLEQAKIKLSFDRTKAAKMVLKAIKSAEANALHNNKMSSQDLYISELWVGSGDMYKSGQFVAKGRFSPLLKRLSNIYVGLSQRSKTVKPEQGTGEK